MLKLGTYKKSNSYVIQYTVGKREIVGSICCGCLNRNDRVVDTFNLIQIRSRIVDVSRSHSNVQNDSMISVQCLVREIVLANRFARSIHMTSLRVSSANALATAVYASFERFASLSLRCFPALTV